LAATVRAEAGSVAIGRLQAKVTAALKIKLTKKSVKDDVCKLGSPLVAVLSGVVGLQA
jgi:hypothetical protein